MVVVLFQEESSSRLMVRYLGCRERLTGFSTGDHGGDSATRGVVSVNVNGDVWPLRPQCPNERLGGGRLQQTGHVFDAKNVSPRLDQLLGKIHVVVEGVLKGRWNSFSSER